MNIDSALELFSTKCNELLDDHDNPLRECVIQAITIMADPKDLANLLDNIVAMLKYNYYNGDEAQKLHVIYVLKEIIGIQVDEKSTNE